jgi:hypothetical protein
MSVLLEISEAKAIHWKTAELAGPGKCWPDGVDLASLVWKASKEVPLWKRPRQFGKVKIRRCIKNDLKIEINTQRKVT